MVIPSAQKVEHKLNLDNEKMVPMKKYKEALGVLSGNPDAYNNEYTKNALGEEMYKNKELSEKINSSMLVVDELLEMIYHSNILLQKGLPVDSYIEATFKNLKDSFCKK